MSYAHAFGPIIQHAWIVPDLAAAMNHWIKNMGVGPWTVFRNVVLTGTYLGQPNTVKFDVGLSYLQGLEIELICPAERGVSPYHHADGARHQGPHHVAWMPTDWDAKMADVRARGLEVVYEASAAATRVAYARTKDQPGALFEIIEGTPMMVDGFKTRAAAAVNWDGNPRVDVIDFGA